MDESKNPHAKTDRKEGNFRFHFDHSAIRRDFGIKSARAEKGKKFLFFVGAPFPLQNFFARAGERSQGGRDSC